MICALSSLPRSHKSTDFNMCMFSLYEKEQHEHCSKFLRENEAALEHHDGSWMTTDVSFLGKLSL